MSEEDAQQPAVPELDAAIERLCRKGDARETGRWHEGAPDYVGEFGLRSEHVPALVDIARRWLEVGDRPDDETFFAPVHAWRALGQLRAVEAVEPLLAMQKQLDKEGDD